MTPEPPKPSPETPLTLGELREMELRWKANPDLARVIDRAIQRRLFTP